MARKIEINLQLLNEIKTEIESIDCNLPNENELKDRRL